jgi:hypothetical protein
MGRKAPGGVAATERFPQLAADVLPIAIGRTLVFEVVGPVCSRAALRACAGERPLDDHSRLADG